MEVAESAFVALKRELALYEYSEPLGIETAPLVRRLLSDFVLATENFELQRQRAEQSARELASWADRVEVLERENVRLVSENNEVSCAQAGRARTARWGIRGPLRGRFVERDGR
jgi:hypothetical protein